MAYWENRTLTHTLASQADWTCTMAQSLGKTNKTYIQTSNVKNWSKIPTRYKKDVDNQREKTESSVSEALEKCMEDHG